MSGCGPSRKKTAREEARHEVFRAEVVSKYPRKTIGSVANRVSTKSGEVHTVRLCFLGMGICFDFRGAHTAPDAVGHFNATIVIFGNRRTVEKMLYGGYSEN